MYIFCFTMPHPRTSSQSPSQKTSSSHDGLVNGKYASTQRTRSGSVSSCAASDTVAGSRERRAAALACAKISTTISSSERLRWAAMASASAGVW